MSHRYAWHFPNQQPASRSGSQSRPQGKQSYTYGKFNHVSIEEAQQAQDVVLGMFFTSSHPTIVLFYLRASHSFISLAYVAKYHLPMSIMKHTMHVSSPRGEMRMKHICLIVSITIRGVDFLANLIILDSKGIDIIQGHNYPVCQKSSKVDHRTSHYSGIFCSHDHRPD
jgi:hypothetical protein